MAESATGEVLTQHIPGRGCHDAIRALHHHLYGNEVQIVIDVDLSGYFDSIDHEYLLAFLRMKIQDERFLRYVSRMFKAGVLWEGELAVSDEGVPQGSICSPPLHGLSPQSNRQNRAASVSNRRLFFMAYLLCKFRI